MVGAVYANKFPDRVRAMALDGNVNPTAWSRPQRGRNDGRFLPGGLRFRADEETAKTLDAFLDLCGREGTARCAFSAGSPEAARAKFTELLARLPVDAAAGQTSYAEALSGTIRDLYFMSSWKHRAAALQGSTPWRDSAQEYWGLTGPGTTSRAPRGRCAAPAATPDRGTNGTPNPVLVIGNTFDPAAPLRGAKAMARQLARTRLLTMDGYGHAALFNPSACVKRYEARYFIKGALPPRGTTCPQDGEPFSPGP